MSSVIRDLAAEVKISKNNHAQELTKMRETFNKKIKKEKEEVKLLERQNIRMKKMVR